MSSKKLLSPKERVIVRLCGMDYVEEDKSPCNMKRNGKPSPIVQFNLVHNRGLHYILSDKCSYGLVADCIGLKNEDCIKNEISQFVLSMIVKNLKSKVLRFASKRELDLVFLHSLFKHELEKYLSLSGNTAQIIFFKYRDIGKYDIINMLNNEGGKPLKFKRKEPHCKNQSPTKEFFTFQEFFNWINKDFIYLWSRGKGHDLLELEVAFTSQNDDHNFFVKLAVVQVYLSAMDLNVKADLRYFLQNHSLKRKEKKFSSLVMKHLQDFAFKADEQNLLIFDAAIFKGGISNVKEMLNLADLAYTGVHRDEQNSSKNPNDKSEMVKPENFLKQNSTRKVSTPKTHEQK